MTTDDERLAFLRGLVDSDDDWDPAGNPAPDPLTAAAAAVGEHFGWWYDPVLSPETALEYAQVVSRALAGSEWIDVTKQVVDIERTPGRREQ